MARILVVDADPSVCALVRAVLEPRGHAVALADDGYAALRAAAAERPDAVVLDVGTPGMDGHQVLARLRAVRGGRELPVVMLTGTDDDATAWRAWTGGADRVLGKPVDAGLLLRHLDELTAGADGLRC